MHKQAGLSIILLFSANILTIEADTDPERVKYEGATNPAAGKPWSITCTGLTKTDVVKWTRNGVSIESEIDSKELTVTNTISTSSTLSASAAKSSHQGEYKCTSAPSSGHYLRVPGIVSATPTQVPVVSTVAPSIDRKFYVLVHGRDLTLVCNTNSNAPVHWKLGKSKVTNDGEHYELVDNGKQLILSNPVNSIFGNYTCSHDNSASDFLSFYRVIGEPQVKLLGNSYVVEGEKLHLVCSTSANLGPNISWVFGEATYSTSKDRVTLSTDEEQGIDNAVLNVENITLSDAGRIYCLVSFTNSSNEIKVEGFTELVVKSRLAALWPFLGICVEVLILYVITRAYEKTGKKTEIYESDTDQTPETTPTSNTDSEMRYRRLAIQG